MYAYMYIYLHMCGCMYTNFSFDQITTVLLKEAIGKMRTMYKFVISTLLYAYTDFNVTATVMSVF